MPDAMNIGNLWGLYLLLALALLGCLGLGLALILRLIEEHGAESFPASDRPYSHLLPLLAADVLSPAIRRLYVKSLLVDATVDEHLDGMAKNSPTGQAMRECRRLLNDLQTRPSPPDGADPLMTRIDEILDEALEIARLAPEDDQRWRSLFGDFRGLRRKSTAFAAEGQRSREAENKE
jgi:hypothetical protein